MKFYQESNSIKTLENFRWRTRNSLARNRNQVQLHECVPVKVPYFLDDEFFMRIWSLIFENFGMTWYSEQCSRNVDKFIRYKIIEINAKAFTTNVYEIRKSLPDVHRIRVRINIWKISITKCWTDFHDQHFCSLRGIMLLSQNIIACDCIWHIRRQKGPYWYQHFKWMEEQLTNLRRTRRQAKNCR